MFTTQFSLTKTCSAVVGTPAASYFGDPGFGSQPKDQLLC